MGAYEGLTKNWQSLNTTNALRGLVTDGLVLALDAGNKLSYLSEEQNLVFTSDQGIFENNDNNGVVWEVVTNVLNPFNEYSNVLKCNHDKNVSGYFQWGHSHPLQAGQTYTLSFYFKNETVVRPFNVSSTVTGPALTVYTGGGLNRQPTSENFDQVLNADIPYPNGWFKQVKTFTATTNQGYIVGFNIAVGQVPLGIFYLFGFQLEKGTQATSYMRTDKLKWYDLSGNNNNGNLSTYYTGRSFGSPAATSYRTFDTRNGGSIYFNPGITNYIQVNHNNNFSFGSSDFTFEAVFASTLAAEHRLISKGITLLNSLEYAIGVTTGGAAYIATSADGTNSALYTSTTTFLSNQWAYLTVTKVGDTATFYVNGEFKSSGSGLNSTMFQGIANLIIGANGNITNLIFKDRMAIIRLYNRALSAAEIQQNYNAQKRRFGLP